jgi:hypothetical protein
MKYSVLNHFIKLSIIIEVHLFKPELNYMLHSKLSLEKCIWS